MSLIQKTHNAVVELDTASAAIVVNASALVEDAPVLLEHVTHVLSNLAATVMMGAPFEIASPRSIAAILAGVDVVSQSLPEIQDSVQQNTLLRNLVKMEVGRDGELSTHVVPIAELGAANPAVFKKYEDMVNAYQNAPTANPAFAQMIRSLQAKVDRAIIRATRGTVNSINGPKTTANPTLAAAPAQGAATA